MRKYARVRADYVPKGLSPDAFEKERKSPPRRHRSGDSRGTRRTPSVLTSNSTPPAVGGQQVHIVEPSGTGGSTDAFSTSTLDPHPTIPIPTTTAAAAASPPRGGMQQQQYATPFSFSSSSQPQYQQKGGGGARSNIERLPWKNIRSEVLVSEKDNAATVAMNSRKPWKRKSARDRQRYRLQNSTSPVRGQGNTTTSDRSGWPEVPAGSTPWAAMEQQRELRFELRKFRRIRTPAVPSDLDNTIGSATATQPSSLLTLKGVDFDAYKEQPPTDPSLTPPAIDRLFSPSKVYDHYSPMDMLAATGVSSTIDPELWKRVNGKQQEASPQGTTLAADEEPQVGMAVNDTSVVDQMLFGDDRTTQRRDLLLEAQRRLSSSPARGRGSTTTLSTSTAISPTTMSSSSISTTEGADRFLKRYYDIRMQYLSSSPPPIRQSKLRTPTTPTATATSTAATTTTAAAAAALANAASAMSTPADGKSPVAVSGTIADSIFGATAMPTAGKETLVAEGRTRSAAVVATPTSEGAASSTPTSEVSPRRDRPPPPTSRPTPVGDIYEGRPITTGGSGALLRREGAGGRTTPSGGRLADHFLSR